MSPDINGDGVVESWETSQGIDTFQYVKGQSIVLAGLTAQVEAQLQYSQDIPKSTFQEFYKTLSGLFKLTRSILSEEVAMKINNWLYPGYLRMQPTSIDIINGINIANEFIYDLERIGMNKLFMEPQEPAFMLEGE